MDNLENIANQQKKKLSRSNIIYMPLVATYLIGGAMALAGYVVKHDNPSIKEQLLMTSSVIGYAVGLPLLHTVFDKTINRLFN